MTQAIKIPLNKLLSPKEFLDLKKRGPAEFAQLVQLFKSNTKCEPITVCAALHDMYYILSGVHRAKAALLAGKQEIDANIYRDSEPIGPKTLLVAVKVAPF